MAFNLLRQLRRIGGNSDALSRREVLAAAVAAGGGLLLRDCLAAALPAAKKRVVVIGAGLSGLACADELAYAGYEVTVIEARDRIGGRVQTHTDIIPGKTVEGGGELVGPNQPTWMAYAKRFGLELLPFEEEPADTTSVFELNGELLPRETAKALADEMDSTLRTLNENAIPVPAFSPWQMPNAVELDRQSVQQWIDRQSVSDSCRLAMEVDFTSIYGTVPAWQSYLALLAVVKGGGLDKFWDETDTLHVKGGCQQLAFRLAASLRKRAGNDSLRINQPVQAVRLVNNHVEIEVSDDTIEADDVVLTAPTSVWNKISFTPTLPNALSLQMANSVKYVAVTKDRAWAKAKRSVDACSNSPVQLTWETTAGQGEDGEHAVVAYSSGPGADECRAWASTGTLDANYDQHLKALWGDGFQLRRGRLFDWLADPYSKGTYSCPAPGQVTAAGPLLTEGVGGNLHFAGEHCCYAFTGWMEAALSSGVRLAQRLASRDGLLRPLATE